MYHYENPRPAEFKRKESAVKQDDQIQPRPEASDDTPAKKPYERPVLMVLDGDQAEASGATTADGSVLS